MAEIATSQVLARRYSLFHHRKPSLFLSAAGASLAASSIPIKNRYHSHYQYGKTKCESTSSNTSNSSNNSNTTVVKEKNEESCASCLYTGMATCTGLSLYFAHLAAEAPDRRSKAGFLVVACVWAGIGVKRWQIG